MRKIVYSVGLAAALVLGVPTLASAAVIEPSPSPSTENAYPPAPPTGATLAGSSAVGTCEADVPWISYNIELTDPDSQSTSDEANLILSGGGNTTSIPLGTIVNGTLSGKVLWPGASVDSAGNATGWPGWVYENGAWAQTSGNFAWTRGPISASIKVNPELTVALSYPAATPVCMTDPSGTPASLTSAGLPSTGSDIPVLPIAIGGGILALGGVLLITMRRRARS